MLMRMMVRIRVRMMMLTMMEIMMRLGMMLNIRMMLTSKWVRLCPSGAVSCTSSHTNASHYPAHCCYTAQISMAGGNLDIWSV